MFEEIVLMDNELMGFPSAIVQPKSSSISQTIVWGSLTIACRSAWCCQWSYIYMLSYLKQIIWFCQCYNFNFISFIGYLCSIQNIWCSWHFTSNFAQSSHIMSFFLRTPIMRGIVLHQSPTRTLEMPSRTTIPQPFKKLIDSEAARSRLHRINLNSTKNDHKIPLFFLLFS